MIILVTSLQSIDLVKIKKSVTINTMKSQIYTLENGLTVLLIDTESFPTVTTMILVGAGSRYENTKNNGIAHFFEHMAFKGSKQYPSSFDISSTIEGIGGVFNAFTAKDHTGYWVKAPGAHFETVLNVLSDMILHSLLVPEEIEREKGVIVEEINMYEDMPARKVSDIFDEVIYDGNPLAYDIAGTRDTVMSFNKKTFTDYISTYYHPRNAVVVVAGGLSHTALGNNNFDTYRELVEKKFSGWKTKKKKTFEQFKESQKKPNIKIVNKKTEQAHFCLGYRAFSFSDQRRHALTLLATILGGGMSSRLFMEVRERRGLCYYVSTGRELYADTGYMVTQAGVTNNKEKVNEAVKVIIEQHEQMKNADIKPQEIQKAKELLKGRLLLSLEDSYKVASLQGTRYLFEERLIFPEQIIANIEAVTKEDIVSVAKDLFTEDRLNFAIIGPFDNGDICI